jgi:hypothetical protein
VSAIAAGYCAARSKRSSSPATRRRQHRAVFQPAGQAALRQRRHTSSRPIAAAPRTSCATVRARHDLVIVAELSGFSGMHPDAGGKASPMTPPGAWCVRGSGCRTCRRDHGLPEPTIGFGSTGRAARRSAHLGAGGTPCSTARTGCDRRLEVVGVGRRVAGPVDRRTIPRWKSAGDTGGAVALPSAWLPQRTLGYSGARGMVRDGECTVEHTPIAAGRQLADD